MTDRDSDVRLRADEVSATGGLYGHGWLALVLPADAQRVRADDPDLAAALSDAGATIVEHEADVVIGPAPALSSDAPLEIVELGSPLETRSAPLPVRVIRRMSGSVAVRVVAWRARRVLRRRYPTVETRLWDVTHTLPVGPAAGARLRRRPSEWLPQRALVVGRRGEQGTTLFEAVVEAAAVQAGSELTLRWVSIRAGTIVAAADGAVLRLAVGPARIQIAAQASVLEDLARVRPAELVGARIPWLLGRGRVGLAEWSLERLQPGSRPPRELRPHLLDEAVEFLVELRRVDGGAAGGRSLRELAAVVAAVCQPGEAAQLEELARRLDSSLAGQPVGFAHGDFFAGNLLAEGERLTGVLDWDAGGPGRLPLLDLLHLRRTLIHDGSDLWGHALVGQLLPELRAGGDPLVRRYCAELGIERDPERLEHLLWAYWLDHAGYQLRTHAHRRTDRAWIDANIRFVLDAAARSVLG